MIQLTDIHKTFGNLEILKGIDLTVQPREMVSIVGPSGAGKTTLLQIMGTLYKPDVGKVEIAGQDTLRLSGAKLSRFRCNHIGFIFQFHQLLPEFSALENVMIPGLIANQRESQVKARAKELLDFLNLTQRAQHRPAQLSGGEKQRVAVARALMNKPDVILADEPSGSLDTHNKEELHQLFFRLRDEFGQTFVIVTHDETLAALSDRTIHLIDGLLVNPPQAPAPAEQALPQAALSEAATKISPVPPSTSTTPLYP